jgi:hypothetical protein
VEPEYWFLSKPAYEPLLDQFAVSETDYLSAMQEIAALFLQESSQKYYRTTAAPLGSLVHFDLLPHPNQRLPYNPVHVLLNSPWGGQIPGQLIYLGLALRDFKKCMGQTKAFKDLVSPNITHYRGALFEIEVGSELVRADLRPTYSTNSPDFILSKLSLGVEATMREVPLARAVAEQLTLALAFCDFKYFSIEITAKGDHDFHEFLGRITQDVKDLLDVGDIRLARPNYRIRHDLTKSCEKTIAITFGEYCYEQTLAHLITTVIKEKEEKIRKGTSGGQCTKFVIAIDTRSLLALPLEPESDYERRMAERHQYYYDRLRVFRQQVIGACQMSIAESPLIKGVFLWGRKRFNSPADEVHGRYPVCLVTAEQTLEVDKHNLSAELARIAKG